MKGILRKHSNAYYFYFSLFMEMNLIFPNTVRILYRTSKVDTIFFDSYIGLGTDGEWVWFSLHKKDLGRARFRFERECKRL